MEKAFWIVIALAGTISNADARGGGGGHSGGSHSVAGHITSRGTYVAPHHATNPNHTQRDNWSSKGNVNPYTGVAGTKTPKH